MARYRFNRSGVSLLGELGVLDRINNVVSSFQTWGVQVTDFTVNPSQVTIDTDAAVPTSALGGYTFEQHLGFPLIVVSA